MLQIARRIALLNVSTESINNSFTNLQSIRWRKPRWIPIAKSKRFRVPKRTVCPEEEVIEIQRLYNNYRNHIKSLRRYLHEKYCVFLQSSSDPEEILKIFKQDFARCSAINDQWNAGQKVSRETRIEKQLQDELSFARKRIELELSKRKETLELVEEIVRKEKEASVNYITPENIDEYIDKALAQEVDYNFAIDINGEKIIGRETKPEKIEQKIAMKQ